MANGHDDIGPVTGEACTYLSKDEYAEMQEHFRQIAEFWIARGLSWDRAAQMVENACDEFLARMRELHGPIPFEKTEKWLALYLRICAKAVSGRSAFPKLTVN